MGWAIRASQDASMLRRREDTIRDLGALPRLGRLDRMEYARRLSGRKDSIQETLELWLNWWRDLLLITGGSPDTISNVDLADSLQQEARRYDLRGVVQFVKAIHRTQRALERNADPRLALEVLMLSLPAQGN
jgi:DNA polymerase-3 subunit delta'